MDALRLPKGTPAFPAKKYNIIYADPPWKYENPKNNDPRMGGITYDVMELEEIKKLPIDSISAKDCALFMWVTMPKLREGLEVIKTWGFNYITCAFTWVKLNPSGEGFYSGMGHWTNGNAELCLFAKKGSPKREARNVKQLLIAPRGRHSEKPAETRDRIVELLGDLPRIELFARQAAEGWDCWGKEAPRNIIRDGSGTVYVQDRDRQGWTGHQEKEEVEAWML